MCCGPSVSRLRDLKELEHLSLFGSSGGLDDAPDVEQELITLLGAGFEAAWPDPNKQRKVLELLPAELNGLFKALVETLLGKPPEQGTPARETWNSLNRDVTGMLVKLLQSEVRKVLG